MPSFDRSFERPQEQATMRGEALAGQVLELTQRLARYQGDAEELLKDSPTLRNQAEILARSEADAPQLLEDARSIVGDKGDYAPEALVQAALVLRNKRNSIN